MDSSKNYMQVRSKFATILSGTLWAIPKLLAAAGRQILIPKGDPDTFAPYPDSGFILFRKILIMEAATWLPWFYGENINLIILMFFQFVSFMCLGSFWVYSLQYSKFYSVKKALVFLTCVAITATWILFPRQYYYGSFYVLGTGLLALGCFRATPITKADVAKDAAKAEKRARERNSPEAIAARERADRWALINTMAVMAFTSSLHNRRDHW